MADMNLFQQFLSIFKKMAAMFLPSSFVTS